MARWAPVTMVTFVLGLLPQSSALALIAPSDRDLAEMSMEFVEAIEDNDADKAQSYLDDETQRFITKDQLRKLSSSLATRSHVHRRVTRLEKIDKITVIKYQPRRRHFNRENLYWISCVKEKYGGNGPVSAVRFAQILLIGDDDLNDVGIGDVLYSPGPSSNCPT